MAGSVRFERLPGHDSPCISPRSFAFMVSAGMSSCVAVGAKSSPICCCCSPAELRNHTLPKTNSSPLEMVVSNRNLLFQGSIFRGELLVSGRVGQMIALQCTLCVIYLQDLPCDNHDCCRYIVNTLHPYVDSRDL